MAIQNAGPEIWRTIVERVSSDAIGLAIVRNGLRLEDDEAINDAAIVADTVACLTGDDIGCGEEEDVDDPEKCAGAFVRSQLDAYAVLSPRIASADRIEHYRVEDARVGSARMSMFALRCSACFFDFHIDYPAPDFCPKCGAKFQAGPNCTFPYKRKSEEHCCCDHRNANVNTGCPDCGRNVDATGAPNRTRG